MKESLKQKLLDLIQLKRYVTLTELHNLTYRMGHKESNAERRLRELVKAGVVKTERKEGVIIGYHYINSSTGQEVPKPIQTPLIGLNLPSGNTYKSHYDN